jgi:hypothetical protein
MRIVPILAATVLALGLGLSTPVLAQADASGTGEVLLPNKAAKANSHQGSEKASEDSKAAHAKEIEDCMAYWDKATHMTKALTAAGRNASARHEVLGLRLAEDQHEA